MAQTNNNNTTNVQDEQRERIVYIYRCPECGKFYEEGCRNDSLICSCGSQVVMSTPEYTIKHYKKSRMVFNLLTILFTIVLPIFTLCMFMFVKEPVEANPESINYKLPILSLVLIGTVVLKGRDVLERTALNTNITALRCLVVFISKNALYVIVMSILGIILAYINTIGPAIKDILVALSVVIIENSIGYCVFDHKYHEANYLIKRAMRQSETIQAMEMSGR